MRNKRENEQLDLETLPSGPVSFRREVRSEGPRCRVNKRRAASTSRRKTAKPGGIHQRANKRTNW